MPFTPLAFGTSASPLTNLSPTQIADLFECGALDLGLLNALFKKLSDRIDAVDAADNTIDGATYDASTNTLTLSMTDGPDVPVVLTALIADAVASGALNSATYNQATNVLTFGFANGTTYEIDMSALIADAAGASVPQGGIIMYTGSVAPATWAFCDGTQGTPDLRDKFVLGAGPTNALGVTGGALTHVHAIGGTALTAAQMPEHFHYMAANIIRDVDLPNDPESSLAWSNGNNPGEEEVELPASGAQNATMGRTSMAGGVAGTADTHTHSIAAGSNVPPFYTLAYIMKL